MPNALCDLAWRDRGSFELAANLRSLNWFGEFAGASWQLCAMAGPFPTSGVFLGLNRFEP